MTAWELELSDAHFRQRSGAPLPEPGVRLRPVPRPGMSGFVDGDGRMPCCSDFNHEMVVVQVYCNKTSAVKCR